MSKLSDEIKKVKKHLNPKNRQYIDLGDFKEFALHHTDSALTAAAKLDRENENLREAIESKVVKCCGTCNSFVTELLTASMSNDGYCPFESCETKKTYYCKRWNIEALKEASNQLPRATICQKCLDCNVEQIKEDFEGARAALKTRTHKEILALIEKYGDPQYKTNEFALYDVISVAQQFQAKLSATIKTANSRICSSCGQAHDIDIMCPSPEVRLKGACWYHKTIERLQTKLSAETNLKEAILQQARGWAMEARTQRHTVNEIGSALGGMADWEPIAKEIEKLLAALSALQWTKVSEGLPEVGDDGLSEPLLIMDASREWCRGCYVKHTEPGWFAGDGNVGEPTHYRYITLPEEAEDE